MTAIHYFTYDPDQKEQNMSMRDRREFRRRLGNPHWRPVAPPSHLSPAWRDQWAQSDTARRRDIERMYEQIEQQDQGVWFEDTNPNPLVRG